MQRARARTLATIFARQCNPTMLNEQQKWFAPHVNQWGTSHIMWRSERKKQFSSILSELIDCLISNTNCAKWRKRQLFASASKMPSENHTRCVCLCTHVAAHANTMFQGWYECDWIQISFATSQCRHHGFRFDLFSSYVTPVERIVRSAVELTGHVIRLLRKVENDGAIFELVSITNAFRVKDLSDSSIQ